jgi:hypothetical protein
MSDLTIGDLLPRAETDVISLDARARAAAGRLAEATAVRDALTAFDPGMTLEDAYEHVTGQMEEAEADVARAAERVQEVRERRRDIEGYQRIAAEG